MTGRMAKAFRERIGPLASFAYVFARPHLVVAHAIVQEQSQRRPQPRARGAILYILGNASALVGKGSWDAVLNELEEQEAIGPAFGLQCARHPDSTSWVVEPTDFDHVAPGGESTDNSLMCVRSRLHTGGCLEIW